MNLRNGDIFVSRWFEDEPNTSPGYWNHTAIYCNGNVVESLIGMGVVQWTYEQWLPRMQRFIVMRQNNPDIGNKAAEFAPTLVGIPYRQISSLFRYLPWWRTKKGLNCIAVVRLAYKEAFGKDPGWIIPDHVIDDSRFLSIDDFDQPHIKEVIIYNDSFIPERIYSKP